MKMNDDFDPRIVHHFSDDLYIRQMVMPAGKSVLSHKHKTDHFSILGKGTALVGYDGISIQYDAPACILIEKERHHSIKAITDIEWYCIHAVKIVDREDIDSVLIGE